MQSKTIWTAALAVYLAIAVWWVGSWAVQTALLSRQHELGIQAYLDCVAKYAAAKASGKFQGLDPMPSSSEVCEKSKR